MILGDNPARHGFLLTDLVLIELLGHVPPLPRAWGGGVKILLGGEVIV